MSSEIRERGRAILRAELAAAAADFCADRGFDQVTSDDIAHNIGVSRATFFRYFGSKEDAVVAAAMAGRPDFAAGVRAQATGTTAFDAVRAAMEPTVKAARSDPRRLLARIVMIGSSPGLTARLSLRRAADRDDLAGALADRTGDIGSARAAAAAAMAALDLGWNLWSTEPGSDLGHQFDRAFRLVADAGTTRLTR